MFDHFFIVGAQRSGTTFLYRILNSHPEIQMAIPERPEPKFFLKKEDMERGVEYYYSTYFPVVANEVKILGEKSTSYYESETVPLSIRNFFSNAKIIFLLRNPVERAISNYYFSVQHGLENRSIEDVFLHEKPHPVLANTISVNPFDYLQRSRYTPYIKKYLEIFGDKVKILITEEIVDGSQGIWTELFEFLGVFNLKLNSNDFEKVNESQKAKVDQERILSIKPVIFENIKDDIYSLEKLLKRDIIEWKMKN